MLWEGSYHDFSTKKVSAPRGSAPPGPLSEGLPLDPRGTFAPSNDLPWRSGAAPNWLVQLHNNLCIYTNRWRGMGLPRWAAHPEDQVEDENYENLRKNEREYRRMNKKEKLRTCSFLAHQGLWVWLVVLKSYNSVFTCAWCVFVFEHTFCCALTHGISVGGKLFRVKGLQSTPWFNL